MRISKEDFIKAMGEDEVNEMWNDSEFMNALSILGYRYYEEDDTIEIPDDQIPDDMKDLETLRTTINTTVDRVNEHTKLLLEVLKAVDSLNKNIQSIYNNLESLGNHVNQNNESFAEAMTDISKVIPFTIQIVCDANGLDPVDDVPGFFKNLKLGKYAQYCTNWRKLMAMLERDYGITADTVDSEGYDETLTLLMQFYCRVVYRDFLQPLEEYLDQEENTLYALRSIIQYHDTLDFISMDYLVRILNIIKDDAFKIFMQYYDDIDFEILVARRDELKAEVISHED